ncbi:MAG TPA: TIR domain-containing protein [Thermoanaerobaculia bacterium]|nr:TIR domain-containing protein [Thermoanaerobaculia bacterium]
MTTPTRRFRIALSFPSERRPFVEQVAEELSAAIGKDKVLYDGYYEAEFARIDLDTYLQSLYHEESELIAVFLCTDYEQKEWCGLEWRAVRDLIKRRQAASVMPLRLDDTEIPGLFSTDGYLWIGDRSPADVANRIVERLQKQDVAEARRELASAAPSGPGPERRRLKPDRFYRVSLWTLAGLAVLGLLLATLGFFTGAWLGPHSRARKDFLIAYYPGYKYETSRKDLLPLLVPTYSDLAQRVRDNHESIEILRLNTGVYTRMLQNPERTHINRYRCFNYTTADDARPNELEDSPKTYQYHSALLVSRACLGSYSDLGSKLTGLRGEGAKSAQARFDALKSWIQAEVQGNAANGLLQRFLAESLVFVDPNSSSGFYVPLKDLGLGQTIPGGVVNCAGNHAAALDQLLAPGAEKSCLVIATALSDLTDSQIAELQKRGHLLLMDGEVAIPDGPTCIRKDIRNPEQVLKTYLGYKELRAIDGAVEQSYQRFFSIYVQPAIPNGGEDGDLYHCR